MGWTSQYILENENGDRWNLTAPNDVFLVNVEGLGATSNRTFADLNDGFFREINSELPQNGITGDLVYLDGAYRNYQILVDWLIAAKRLFFCYTPQDEEFRREVKLNFIQKDRRNASGLMRAAISFYPLTPWYKETEITIEIRPDDGTEKAYYQYSEGGTIYYGYQYTDDLKYGGSAGGTMSATLNPVGHDPAGFVLRYYGAITNPKIRLVGSKTYGLCSITATFSANDILELSTMPDDCHVWKISGGTTTDLVTSGAVDLQYIPYSRIPSHEQSVLSIESTVSFSGNADLTVYPAYRSV